LPINQRNCFFLTLLHPVFFAVAHHLLAIDCSTSTSGFPSFRCLEWHA
jgi:hypothetical protein